MPEAHLVAGEQYTHQSRAGRGGHALGDAGSGRERTKDAVIFSVAAREAGSAPCRGRHATPPLHGGAACADLVPESARLIFFTPQTTARLCVLTHNLLIWRGNERTAGSHVSLKRQEPTPEEGGALSITITQSSLRGHQQPDEDVSR
jgi:hypothetical protein